MSNSIQHLAAYWTNAWEFSAGQSPRFFFRHLLETSFGSIRHLIQLEQEISSHGLKQLERESDYSCPLRPLLMGNIVIEASPSCHIFIFVA